MTSSTAQGERGFTLIEVIVVLAVLGILVGTAMPLFVKLQDHRKGADVREELEEITQALDAYYYDKGMFPTTLRDKDFYGLYLQPGVQGTAVVDAFGGQNDYLFTKSVSPDRVDIWSRGPNGKDDNRGGDDIAVLVQGSPPGYRKTRERMRVIVEQLANFLESGGSLTGNWSQDRVNLGLGAVYERDGFGTSFRLDAATLELRSAGPDRNFSTADDLGT